MVAVGLSGIKKGCRGDSGSGRLGKAHAGPSSSFTDGPASPYLPVAKLPRPSRSSPTRRGVRLGEDSEVDHPGGEVEGRLLAIVDHRDAVAVPIAGSRHAALEDGEGRPGGHGRAGVGWGSRQDLRHPRAELAAWTSRAWPLRGWSPSPGWGGADPHLFLTTTARENVGVRQGHAGCGLCVSAATPASTGVSPLLLLHRVFPCDRVKKHSAALTVETCSSESRVREDGRGSAGAGRERHKRPCPVPGGRGLAAGPDGAHHAPAPPPSAEA